MSTLKAYGKDVNSIFQLIGDKENDITKSIAWTFLKCPVLLEHVLAYLFEEKLSASDVQITYQNYDADTGITDVEITDNDKFFLIIEAKRGWLLPGSEQLTKYSIREDFVRSPAQKKMIASMSECTEEYALSNLPFSSVNGISVKHISWKKIYNLVNDSRKDSNNEQKHILEQLYVYLKGIMTMQNKDSNWVYVVALSSGYPDSCCISWQDIVNVKSRYCHPVGGSGWPKNPPNYIAFRYNGKLQSIHHIDYYIVTKNLHDEVPEMPDVVENINYFVYYLGKPIKPSKEVRTGNIYPNGRVWAMLDTLFTSDTISQARDISKER